MSQLRIAVVGTGHLGRIHARLLQQVERCRLVAVVDPVRSVREAVAEEAGCQAWDHYELLDGKVDAAVVATPTRFHHGVTHWLLSRGIHTLVEKPITSTLPEANDLIRTASDSGCVLQVGHVERFNPAWNAIAPHLEAPRYIEAVRRGPYTFRSTDVSIVHDLMIHDIDLVLSLVGSPVTEVEAVGTAWLSPLADLAYAHLRFANGCLANLSASRVSYLPQRSMQIYAAQALAHVDFAAGRASLVEPAPEVLQHQVDLSHCPHHQREQMQASIESLYLPPRELPVPKTNAILEEQREFVASVLDGQPIRVAGTAARSALEVAERIEQAIYLHREDVDTSQRPTALLPRRDRAA